MFVAFASSVIRGVPFPAIPSSKSTDEFMTGTRATQMNGFMSLQILPTPQLNFSVRWRSPVSHGA